MNRLLNRYFDWNAERQARWEDDAVRGIFHAGATFAWLGGWVFCLIVFVVSDLATGWWVFVVHGLTYAVIGMYAGLGAASALRQRKGYRRGWFKGRSAMVAAMQEAQQRDMPFPVWILTEAERETINAIGGIPYPLPRPQEGDE